MFRAQQQLTVGCNWLSLWESWQSRQALTERASRVSLTLDRAQVALLAAVDAHGLNVDTGNGDQVGALLLIEVVQVGLMLEVVGVALAILNDGVGDQVSS